MRQKHTRARDTKNVSEREREHFSFQKPATLILLHTCAHRHRNTHMHTYTHIHARTHIYMRAHTYTLCKKHSFELSRKQ